MTPASSSRRLALLAAMASSLLLAACGGGGGDGNGNTNLRAINLTTDLPSLDLYAGDTRRFSALATDSIASAVTLEANTYTMEVKRADAAAPLLASAHVDNADALVAGPFLHLWPHVHQTDGFFAAVWRRR